MIQIHPIRVTLGWLKRCSHCVLCYVDPSLFWKKWSLQWSTGKKKRICAMSVAKRLTACLKSLFNDTCIHTSLGVCQNGWLNRSPKPRIFLRNTIHNRATTSSLSKKRAGEKEKGGMNEANGTFADRDTFRVGRITVEVKWHLSETQRWWQTRLPS